VIEIKLHPNSMNMKDGFCQNKSWKPLIWSLRITGSILIIMMNYSLH
jgi:hypothetical protein